MVIGKKYEITYPMGGVTTVEVIDADEIHHYFEYLEGEYRKQINPLMGTNRFCLPSELTSKLKYKEI